MTKTHYTRLISCPVREEMFQKVQKICEDEDIPVSVFLRKIIKMYIEKEYKHE